MRIVAIIPARYGSTRFEGKPLAPIAGKPMIQHVYESAARAQRVSEVVVATDDERIADAVGRFGGRVRMTSAENRSGTDRVAEVAEQMSLAADDIVINVQGDQPLVRSECFDAVVEPLLAEAELGMSTLAFVIRDWQEYTNPKDCKVVMDQNHNALYFSRAAIPFDRDGLPGMQAFKHLGVYAYTRRFFGLFRELPPRRQETMEKQEHLRAQE